MGGEQEQAQRLEALAAWFEGRAAAIYKYTDESFVRTRARAEALRSSAAYIRAALAGRPISVDEDAVLAEFGRSPSGPETP